VIRQGAAALIVSELIEAAGRASVIRVADTVQAFGALGGAHRRRFSIPVIAVTGSCGKTTTKEMTATLLGATRRVVKTHLTENNHIGLPLTLLRLTSEDRAAIVELGSNHPGEIAYLAAIAQPTVAVITNIGPAHLEFFGSIEGVIREKLSLLEALGRGGVAVVPGDQLEVVLEAKRRLPAGASMMTFGMSGQCGVRAMDIRRDEDGSAFRVRGVDGVFVVPVAGSHQIENALAALACAKALGIPLETLREPLAACRALPMRSEVVRCGGVTVINDCYNANPLSFARALETLRDLPVSRRVLVAGDMLELGAHTKSAHRAIGRLAADSGVASIVAIGAFASEFARGAAEVPGVDVRTYHTAEAAWPAVAEVVRSGDGLLVKGSRRLKLEQIATRIIERHTAQVCQDDQQQQPAQFAGQHADL